jgi:hypothetical protein
MYHQKWGPENHFWGLPPDSREAPRSRNHPKSHNNAIHKLNVKLEWFFFIPPLKDIIRSGGQKIIFGDPFPRF